MNYNKSTFYLFLIFLLFGASQAYAQKSLVGSKDLPLEINLLVESYQSFSPESFSSLLPIAKNIDTYARNMTKEDIFFIGKIEIYKTLLKNYDSPVRDIIDGNSIATLKLAVSKSEDKFIKWFLQALLKDAQNLLNNKSYKELLLQKNAAYSNNKIEYRKLEKKAELMQFWISKINPNSQDYPDSLKRELTPKMLLSLKNIENSFKLMALESNIQAGKILISNESDLKFFSIIEKTKVDTEKTPISGEKSVEDILAPITETPNANDLPQPSSESWIDDQNTPPELQNLPKPSNDANWLEDF